MCLELGKSRQGRCWGCLAALGGVLAEEPPTAVSRAACKNTPQFFRKSYRRFRQSCIRGLSTTFKGTPAKLVGIIDDASDAGTAMPRAIEERIKFPLARPADRAAAGLRDAALHWFVAKGLGGSAELPGLKDYCPSRLDHFHYL
jgi:hypothetical protein